MVLAQASGVVGGDDSGDGKDEVGLRSIATKEER